MGHRKTGETVPVGQYQPPVHDSTAAVRPAVGHCCPAVQGTHWESRVLPSAPEKVPAGHSVAALLPARQYAPVGHTLPVVPSLGVEEDAPSMQRQPAEQRPEGLASPEPAQK